MPVSNWNSSQIYFSFPFLSAICDSNVAPPKIFEDNFQTFILSSEPAIQILPDKNHSSAFF